MDSRYMKFHVTPDCNYRKTKTVDIQNKSSGVILGTIKWYPGWRQYCFLPAADCVFSKGCLEDIGTAIAELMNERKGRPHADPRGNAE